MKLFAAFFICCFCIIACSSGGTSGDPQTRIERATITGDIYNSNITQGKTSAVSSTLAGAIQRSATVALPDVSISQMLSIESTVNNTGTVDIKNAIMKVEVDDGTGTAMAPSYTLCMKCFNLADGSGVAGCNGVRHWDGYLPDSVCDETTDIDTYWWGAMDGYCKGGPEAGIDCTTPFYHIIPIQAGPGKLIASFGPVDLIEAGTSYWAANGADISGIAVPTDKNAGIWRIWNSHGDLLSEQSYTFTTVP